MTYAVVLLLIGLAILAHELGHFIAAMLARIPVERFSIGFGPKVWGVRRGETEYRLSLIPLGGYVLPAVGDEAQFFRLPLRKRVILAVGGPVASLLLPVPCFMVLAALSGEFSVGSLLWNPISQTLDLTIRVLSAVPALFSQPEQLSGVVGIVAQGGQVIGGSFRAALRFLAFMSLNLGVLNLLPIPALDGGKLFLYALEKIHPGLQRLHVPLSMAGWVLIVGLILYVTVMDVTRML
jgi:regulator of sigma E protease